MFNKVNKTQMNLKNDDGRTILEVKHFNNAEYQWQYGRKESADWITMGINKYNVCILADDLSKINGIRFRCLVFLKGKVKYYSNVIVLNSVFDTKSDFKSSYSDNNQTKSGYNKRQFIHSVEETDGMDGLQFEKYCADILSRIGYYDVRVTKASGDFGVDILATKDDVTYAIQCKSYSDTVGNKAVQEAYSGKSFYGYMVAAVLTNNYFTSQAIETAKKTSVLLWDRDVLNDMIINAFSAKKDDRTYKESSDEDNQNNGDIDFFGQCKTEDELKNRRNQLLKIYHSDTGSGDDKMAAMINRQYEERISIIRGNNK